MVSHLATPGNAQGLVLGLRRQDTWQDCETSGKSALRKRICCFTLFPVSKKEKIVGFAKDTSHRNSQLIGTFFGLTFGNFIKI